MKSRRGFTLIEILAATIMLAIVVIACTQLTGAISSQKTTTESTVYLSTHNLNCMERMRQKAASLGGLVSEHLLDYYGDDEFGTTDIETHIFVETASLEQFWVYRVTIQSKMRDLPQRLTSKYILTNIGLQDYDENINGPIGGLEHEGNPAEPPTLPS